MAERLIRKFYRTKSQRNALAIYLAIGLLFFHSYLVAYINSSFIDQYVGSSGVGAVFTIGSALTVIIFLVVSHILERFGNYRTTLWLLLINFLAVGGLAFADSLRTAIPLFIVHLTILPLIIFNFDVFLEENIGKQETTTGAKRGLLLALTSFVAAATPLFTGYLVGGENAYTNAYYASALSLIPIVAIIFLYFRNFKDPKYQEIKVFSAIHAFWVSHDIRFVFCAHFLLQMFFFFMIVYTPLYLSTVIELSWQNIGIILFACQLAYVFFDYPIGRFGDLYFGEKEMMAFGFLILACATASLSLITTDSVWVWALIMFLTRTGASLAEVTTESYFFKHTTAKDAQVISFFRLTRPLSYVIGALIGGLVLLYLPFNLVFVIAGLLMLPGVIMATKLNDTR